MGRECAGKHVPVLFCKCCLKDAVSNSDILHIFSVDMVIRYSGGMSNFAT